MKRFIFLTLLTLSACISAEARQPQKGYRGFIDFNGSLRKQELLIDRPMLHYLGASTTHGYQINQMFFVGGGLGMERCNLLENWIAPIYVDGRADFLFGRFTPFADIRLGANLAEGTGIYFAPSIGYRFNWGRKMGINIGAGLSLAGYHADHYEGYYYDETDYKFWKVGRKHHTRAYFSFRIGIDF